MIHTFIKQILTTRLAFITTVVALTGCTAPGTNFFNVVLPQVVDTNHPPADQCFFVTRITVKEIGSAQGLPANLMIRRDNPGGAFYNVGIFSVPSGTDFRVTALSPGKYVWRELSIGRYSGVFKEEFKFECIERQVTYIGDLDLSIDWRNYKYGIGFVDRFRLAEWDYSYYYPKLASTVQIKSAVIKSTIVESTGQRESK